MVEQDIPLKLAVLLHADVVDSTGLVRRNESLAHHRIQHAFQSLSETITSHGGIAQEIRGDALVAEFSKSSDAISASVEFQQHNDDYNRSLEDDIRPQIRIGIAMGEVVIADKTVTGEGVVLAQRLEQLAEAGGICIDSAVYQTVPKRLPFTYEKLGDRQIKGFDEPVRVYVVSQNIGTSAPKSEELLQSGKSETSDISDKPSIAVLPFKNRSGDPDQEFFSEGITEDIITELSRFPILRVISQHSSFAFKEGEFNINRISDELGVQYVVEGSIRRSSSQIRVTAQLIEANSGTNIWGERYDRDVEEIFAVQDDVTRAIVATISAQLGKSVSENAARKPTSSIRSYEYLLRANQSYHRFNPDDNMEAARLFQKAIDLDPQFARAYAGLANTYATDYFLGWQRTNDALKNGIDNAQKALEFDSSDPLARTILAWALIGNGDWDQAEYELDRALKQNPGDADLLAELGNGLKAVGRVDDGIALLKEAINLNPLAPDSYLRWLGQAFYRAERYTEASDTLRVIRPEGWGYGWLAASFARLGEAELARKALKSFVTQRKQELESSGAPANTTLELLGNYKANFRHEIEWEHLLEGLHMAGLSDEFLSAKNQ